MKLNMVFLMINIYYSYMHVFFFVLFDLKKLPYKLPFSYMFIYIHVYIFIVYFINSVVSLVYQKVVFFTIHVVINML